MKIKFRDKVIAVLLLTVFAVYGVFNYVIAPANKNLDVLKEKKKSVETLMTDIDPLLKKKEEKIAQKEGLLERYELIKSEESRKTATAEEFLVFLGGSTEKNNVKVTGFSDLGNTFEDGVYKAYYDIELSGTPLEISRAVKELDNMGIVFSVGSVSFRQDKEFDYLMRFFDTETNLKWYTEPEEIPEEDEEPVTESKEEMQVTQPPESQTFSQPSQNEPTQEDTKVEPEVIEPQINEGFVIPEGKSLDDIIPTNYFNYIYKVTPLSDSVVSENPYSNEMRLAFTICLIMFNEPSNDTSFINVEKVEETEDVDGVF